MSETEPRAQGQRTDPRQVARVVLLAVALAAVIWFAVANSQRVHVDWFVVGTDSPLIFVIVLSAVLGAALDRLVRWRRRRRD